MKIPVITGKNFQLRPWKMEDASSLAIYANNYNIFRNLRDGFPYPYKLSDAEKWIDIVLDNQVDLILAIEINGEAAGGIGIHGMKDVYRFNAEIGYWLAEIHWGKGIMSQAIGAIVNYAFNNYKWHRIFAAVYQNNTSSMRVLEKNGFTMEAIHRKAVMKEGQYLDEYMYALLREEWENKDD